MRELFIVIIIAMVVFFFLGIVFQILQRRRKPDAAYSCSVCGEHHCDCDRDFPTPDISGKPGEE